MKFAAIATVAAVLFACQTVEAIRFRDCGSTSGKLINVTIAGCGSGVDRCPLPKGKNATAFVEFMPSTQLTSLTAKVFGILGPVNASFPLPNPDACKDSGLTCPLDANKQYTYQSSVYVDPIYPSVAVTVQWELFDQNNQRAICFLVPCQVVSSERPVKGLMDMIVQPVQA